MPTVTIELPSLITAVVDAEPSLPVQATTVDDALRALVREHPALRIHLFDETGGLRPHVLCLHNDRNTRWDDAQEVPVAEGDRITILQAVSGG